MTEIAIRAALEYSRQLAVSTLLPREYQDSPGNVLWAVEYGKTLGITPMAAITGIHVINKKPSASAGLIQGLIRNAGHKFRIKLSGTVEAGDLAATATIIRSDDPDYPFEYTFSIRDAVRAKLCTMIQKDGVWTIPGDSNWAKYPGSMCSARATTGCARHAVEEVLYGLHYTPEELGADVNIAEDGTMTVIAERQPVRSDGGVGYMQTGEVIDVEPEPEPEPIDFTPYIAGIEKILDETPDPAAAIAGLRGYCVNAGIKKSDLGSIQLFDKSMTLGDAIADLETRLKESETAA